MTKRRAGIVAALIALVAAMLFISSGCGSSGGGATGGLEELEPAAILNKAKTAAKAQSSVHLKGSGTASGQEFSIDMSFERATGGMGTLSLAGLNFDLIVLGDSVYVKGDDNFYKTVMGDQYNASIASLLAGKYLKAPVSDARYASVANFADMDAFLTSTLEPSGDISKVDGKSIDGVATVGLKSTSSAGEDQGTLYVANDGTDLPLQIDSSDGNLSLSDWGKVEKITAPPADEVIDLTQLGK